MDNLQNKNKRLLKQRFKRLQGKDDTALLTQNLEEQYTKMIINNDKKYYQLPTERTNDKLSFVLSPSATPEQWNQDPLDYSSPRPGQDGFYSESSRWINGLGI